MKHRLEAFAWYAGPPKDPKKLGRFSPSDIIEGDRGIWTVDGSLPGEWVCDCTDPDTARDIVRVHNAEWAARASTPSGADSGEGTR